jgi:hypothetical protein
LERNKANRKEEKKMKATTRTTAPRTAPRSRKAPVSVMHLAALKAWETRRMNARRAARAARRAA